MKLQDTKIYYALAAGLLALSAAWSYGYVEACKTVACKLQADSAFSKLFNPATPVYIEWKSSDAIFAAIPEFKDDKKIGHLLDVLSENTQRMQASTPKSPSCAVVGNSQNLRSSGYGKRIDSHDYVIRMNNAPIAGYEEDVGGKTTHHIFAHHYGHQYSKRDGAQLPHYSAQTFNILFPIQTGESIRKVIYQKRDYRDYRKFLLNFAEALSEENAAPARLTEADMSRVKDIPNLLALSPEFAWYINMVWFAPDAKQKNERASMGFNATILALHMCDTIDLFGFGADKNGVWGHYFANDGGKALRHRPDFQDSFLSLLEEKNIITIYR